MPAKSTKLSPADERINRYLPDITGQVEYHVVSVLKKGTRKDAPSSFLVAAKLPSSLSADGKPKEEQCVLKVVRSSSACAASTLNLCILQFSDTSASTVMYTAEKNANAKLIEHIETRKEPAAKQDDAPRHVPWPKCYGRLRVAKDIEVLDAKYPAEGRRALLFEYKDGIRLLQKADLTEDLCEKIRAAVALVHDAGVAHRDFYEYNVEPDVGFRNIYLQLNGGMWVRF